MTTPTPTFTAEYLEQRCRDAGHTVSLSGAVGDETCAALLDISPATLRNWRCEGRGPAWRYVSRRVWYDLRSVAAFLSQREAA